MTDSALDRYNAAHKEQWAALVDAARHFGEATVHAIEMPAVKHKITAIRWAMMDGWTAEVILEKGQSAVLSAYAKAKRNGHEKEKVLRWRVPASLADAIQSDNASPDAEEALVSRLARVLGISTSEEFWLYLHAHFGGMSDEQIRHDGGEGPPEKKRK